MQYWRAPGEHASHLYARTVERIRSTGTNMLAFVIGVVAVVCVVCAWAIMKTLDSRFKAKPLTRRILSLQHTTNVESRALPRFDHGPEYGVSLWLYANSLPNTVDNAPVLSHARSPLFAYTGNQPVIGVNFPTLNGGVTPTVYFDHVSTKRWVHLMAVHANRSITLFKDGELYSITHLGRGAAGEVDILSGSLTVGGAPVDAFVSNLVVLNHFPSTADVKSLYRRGPANKNRAMSWIGMGSYSVRSPVFRVG